ncbi:MAG: hypothetical protein AB1782_10645 [Cyanobacteriota bacterium]
MNENSKIDNIINHGTAEILKGKYKEALTIFLNGHKDNPSEINLLYHIAKTYYLLEKPSEVLKYVEQIISIDQNADYAYFLQAKSLIFLSDEFKNAIQPVMKSIALNPNNSYYYSLAAQAFYQTKNYKRAIKLAEDALNIDSNNYEANLVLGNYYEKENEHNKAQEYFTKALNNNLVIDDNQYNITLLHLELAKTKNGLKLIHEAYLKNPDNDAYKWLFKYSYMRNQPLNLPFVWLENFTLSLNQILIFSILFVILVGLMYTFEQFCITFMDIFKWVCSIVFILYLPYQFIVYIALNLYFHFILAKQRILPMS